MKLIQVYAPKCDETGRVRMEDSLAFFPEHRMKEAKGYALTVLMGSDFKIEPGMRWVHIEPYMDRIINGETIEYSIRKAATRSTKAISWDDDDDDYGDLDLDTDEDELNEDGTP